MITRKALGIALVLYLAIGFVFAFSQWLPDVREFTCKSDGNAPFESYLIGTEGFVMDAGTFIASFKNPDPVRCVRKAFERKNLTGLALEVVAWPFVMSMKALLEHEEKEHEKTTHKAGAREVLTVPYEPEINFAGCSKPVRTFLKQMHQRTQSEM